VIERTITRISGDISAQLKTVTETVDNAHAALQESMSSLHQALYDYRASTEISDTFVL